MTSNVSAPSMARTPGETTGASGGRLHGGLGPAKITLMVIAAAAPLMTLGGAVIVGIGLGNGTGLPWTFISISVALLLFAVGFVAMTPHVKSAGAFYSYVHLGLGRRAGLGAGYVALLSYLSIEAGLLGLMGQGTNALLVSYGVPSVSWLVYAGLTIPLLLFFGYRNIDLAGRVLGVLLLLELCVVVVLVVAVILKGGGPEGFTPEVLNPGSMFHGSLAIAVMFAVLSFVGFEAAAVYRDEARDPQTTIPRATYSAIIVVGVFYAIAAWALISGIGASKAVDYAQTNTGTMLNDVARTYLGTAGLHVVELLFVSSAFACVLSFHQIASRYIHALARNHALPAALGHTNDRHASPARASAVCAAVCVIGVIVAAVTGIDPVAEYFTWLGGITSVGVIILMTLTCLATVVFFRRNKDLPAPVWNTLIAPGLGFLCLLYGVFLVVTKLSDLVGGSQPVAFGVLAVLVGAFVAGVLVAQVRPVADVE